MAAATKMTQSQLIKEIAAAAEVSNKVAKTFVTAYADLAVRETKKNGVAILPGIGRTGSRRPQGAHGPQPCHRRSDQDPGQESSKVPYRQGRERFHRSAQESEVGKGPPLKS